VQGGVSISALLHFGETHLLIALERHVSERMLEERFVLSENRL
jgi:hypothetical protein